MPSTVPQNQQLYLNKGSYCANSLNAISVTPRSLTPRALLGAGFFNGLLASSSLVHEHRISLHNGIETPNGTPDAGDPFYFDLDGLDVSEAHQPSLLTTMAMAQSPSSLPVVILLVSLFCLGARTQASVHSSVLA